MLDLLGVGVKRGMTMAVIILDRTNIKKAKGGGFILSNGSAIDDAKPENTRAMMDTVQKFGCY